MSELLVNIDVDRLEPAIDFYTKALDLRLSRRLGPFAAELAGVGAPLYLLEKAAQSPWIAGGSGTRDYRRHWTPVHLDFAVSDLPAAMARAEAAGAKREGEIEDRSWGRIAYFADPFGHGFCLIEFKPGGYDHIQKTEPPAP
jgi:predicted enzyme related to lactoylglutathione lyase